MLDAEGMVDMDITGAESIAELLDDPDERRVRPALARVRTSLRTTLRHLGFERGLGPEHFHLHIRDAVADFVRRTLAEEAAAISSLTAERPAPNPPIDRPEAGRPVDGPHGTGPSNG